jgi:hypothetical protein
MPLLVQVQRGVTGVALPDEAFKTTLENQLNYFIDNFKQYTMMGSEPIQKKYVYVSTNNNMPSYAAVATTENHKVSLTSNGNYAVLKYSDQDHPEGGNIYESEYIHE